MCVSSRFMLAVLPHQLRWGLASLLALILSASASAQHGATSGEWRHHGGHHGFTRYTPLSQVDASNFERLEPVWRWSSADSRVEQNSPYDRQVFRSSSLVIGDRLYIPTELSQVAGARRRHRRGTLGLRSEELRARQAGPEQLLHPRPRVLDRRRAGTAVPRHDRQAARVARPGHRATRPRLRRRRRGRALPEPGAREHRAAEHQPRPARDRGRRHHRRRLPHLRLPAPEQQPAGPRARLRRPHGGVQVAVPHHPPGGRGVCRHLGERLLEDGRQRERLGADDRRPGTRLCLPGHQHAHQRLLRRPPARRQRLLRESHLRRRRDRRAGLALPDRPSRRLGLRHRVRPEPDRHRRRRPADQGRCPGLEDRLHLRLRPRHRRTGVADRGTPGRMA